jgi:tetratricopeptide (TPR) repeat protein
MQAFIVRPFGHKEGIDFDRVEELLVRPGLEHAGIAGRSTGAITEAGNIREDMFQLLLLADLVIADISLHNANVFYELGIRHSLRTRLTYLIRAKVDKPAELRTAADEVPFDLKTDRYLEYDPSDPAASVPLLARGLKETISANRVDSPVFRSLPHLVEPQRSILSPVPLTFANEVDLAASKGQGGKLGLFGSETRHLLWELGGRRLVGRRQFAGKFLAPACLTWELIKQVYPLDLEANLMLGTTYQRLGKLLLSDQCLESVLKNPLASVNDRTEALTLRARNAKVAARGLLTGQELTARGGSALRAGMFRKARDLYAAAFSENLNHFYSGLNAFSLTLLLLGLIEHQRDTWLNMFENDYEAGRDENLLKAEAARLAATVGLSIEGAQSRSETKNDVWVSVSKADYLFLTAQRDNVAALAYEQVLPLVPSFHVGSVRDQLELFSLLDARTERVKRCLQSFPSVVAPPPVLRQAIVFTGHMIDTPGRERARFPKAAEAKARAMIHAGLSQLLNTFPGPAIGIASAASGGDILFHEVCRELQVPTRVLLALPENLFIEHSVSPAGPQWFVRFAHLMETHNGSNEVQVLASMSVLPDWMRDPPDYDIWKRTNMWLLEEAAAAGATNVTLMALWDREVGLPGGTQDFIATAKKRGISVTVLDAKELLA